MVKLDFDATASYSGDIAGLAATSPKVTGQKLSGKSGAERQYDAYAKGLEQQFRTALGTKLPKAVAGKGLRTVYGGVAVRLPADEAKTLLSLPHVAAVQTDGLEKLDTDSSTTFIGAPTVWSQLGGQATAGKGVIFGDLDTGLWPEHPSFADNPALGTPPAAPSGVARQCNYGDNPLTPEVDVFQCNSKLIGGYNFLDTYNSIVPGEVYPDTARDSDGHGTHTTSTAAGDIVSSAPVFGIERGPISGVAPGAWVIEYKVCGATGCFQSDSAAAVEQAILDGVDVINFSISGGSSPYTDPVELAFLDAYNAGILVAASAGNSGPTPGTTDHLSPWVLTVAASTQTREFQSTLTLTDGATSVSLIGSSITKGISTPTSVVLAQNIPGYDKFCSTALPAGTAAGVVVACQRGGGIGRIQKGVNVLAGGAAAMILYNLPLQDTETDNHFLPAVHLADGTAFLAFMAAHPAATATFTDGVKAVGKGDVMAAFSSRGPGGVILKPDITAPGVQILAGNTPTPDAVPGGPAGQYFQAIAGTSMSSPHIAGSALLLAGLHPTWSPGAIKSALMTTANTNVLKEDEVTPADPFDFGAGRVDLTKAGDAALTISDSAVDFFTLGQSDLTAPELNVPSINLPTMPGSITVHRTLTNVTTKSVTVRSSATAPAGSTIRVTPASATIRPGGSRTFAITVTSLAPNAQYFGQVGFTPSAGPALHLPVAFLNQQGNVTLGQSCSPATVAKNRSTTCTVTATNDSFDTTTVNVSSSTNDRLRITGATGATVVRGRATAGPATLAPKRDALPAIAPGTSPGGGYLPLSLFGIPQRAIGDEQALNVNVPAYTFGGRTYTSIGVVSDGYIVLGGSSGAQDIAFTPQTLPDPARPNGLVAPFWTDLDGTGTNTVTGAPYGVTIGVLGDGVNSWVVVDYNIHVFGITDGTGDRNFEVWIGVNGTDDVSFSYDTNALGAGGSPDGLTVGAENASGTGGAQITGFPASEYVVSTTPGGPGGSLSYTLAVTGDEVGNGALTSTLTSDIVLGSTVVRTSIAVTRR
jgi:hypothetical protein